MREDHCTRCGACCAAFRVDFHCAELVGGGMTLGAEGVPVDMTVPVTATLVRMRGTDDASPRCIALAGDIGRSVRCTIYPERPSPCRDFAPYAALGMAEDACTRARARYGLPSLEP